MDIGEVSDGTSNTIAVGEVDRTGFVFPVAGLEHRNGVGRRRVGRNEAVFRAAFVGATFAKAQNEGGELVGPSPGNELAFPHPDGTPGPITGWFRAGPHMYVPTFTATYGINSEWPGMSSFHVGGAHALLGDGSARFLSQNLDWRLFDSLCTAWHGDITGDF